MKDYEQIISTVLVKIAELEKVVQQQASRIGELEKRLSKNSSSSSKAPSSDGLKKPARTISLREKGKHNSGGQKGHKGETLKQIESPDVVKKACFDNVPGLSLFITLNGRTGHNLLRRLFHYKQDVLQFLHDPVVPFTNNDAERDLRMMKCKPKISGGFRSSQGAEKFSRIRGFISTIRKRGLSIISSIQSIFSGTIPELSGI